MPQRSRTGKKEYVNPLTGRPIVEGSKTWNDVLKKGLKPFPKTSSYQERHTPQQKEEILHRCGPHCFLNAEDPSDPKYLVCDPNTCSPSCSRKADAMHKSEIIKGNPANPSPTRSEAARIHALVKPKVLECGRPQRNRNRNVPEEEIRTYGRRRVTVE